MQEQIAKLFPQATFETVDNTLTVTIDDAHWHDLATYLRDQLHMDYLVTIVGMDWVTSLGCIYYMMSTVDNKMVAAKVSTTDRVNPYITSVADLWAIAGIYEREVYDFFGIIFVGNPDMRRLFLNIDWKGFPLRKDYDENDPRNAVSIENERQTDDTYTYVRQADGSVERKSVPVFMPDDFVVNIGPQHPATHGVLRFRTAVDGETIKKIDVYNFSIFSGVANSKRIYF